MSELISTDAAAQRLDVTPQTVRGLIDAGELAGVKVGRLVKVDAASVDQLLERNRIGGDQR